VDIAKHWFVDVEIVGRWPGDRRRSMRRPEEFVTTKGLQCAGSTASSGLAWRGALVCIGTIVYEFFAPVAPPLWLLLLVLGALLGASMALLMVIMHTLLVRATTLRTELDAVI
jgi:hypothetical protein